MWWIILGGSSKKWGFALDWMLSGNRGNTKIACLNSYLMGRKVSVTQISQERGMFDHFCGLDHVFVLVSAQTWLWRRLFFFPVFIQFIWCGVLWHHREHHSLTLSPRSRSWVHQGPAPSLAQLSKAVLLFHRPLFLEDAHTHTMHKFAYYFRGPQRKFMHGPYKWRAGTSAAKSERFSETGSNSGSCFHGLPLLKAD